MRYIEPHAHMVSRTTDDYFAMAMAGCQAISEPAFWASLKTTKAFIFSTSERSGMPITHVSSTSG